MNDILTSSADEGSISQAELLAPISPSAIMRTYPGGVRLLVRKRMIFLFKESVSAITKRGQPGAGSQARAVQGGSGQGAGSRAGTRRGAYDVAMCIQIAENAMSALALDPVMRWWCDGGGAVVRV